MPKATNTPTTPNLTIFVITLNEEARLPYLLDSLKPLENYHVIVVDSGSTDRTQDIAKSYGATFKTRKWEGYGQQKSYAESLCTSPWIMNLDADEALSPNAAKRINDIVANSNSSDVYDLAITVVKEYNHTVPLAPVNWTPRLYRKGKAFFSKDPVLDKLHPIKGAKISAVRAPVYHKTIHSFSHLWQKIGSYTEQQVQKRLENNKIPLAVGVIPSAIFMFLKHYFLRRMFVLGNYGFTYAAILTAARLVRDIELIKAHKARSKR